MITIDQSRMEAPASNEEVTQPQPQPQPQQDSNVQTEPQQVDHISSQTEGVRSQHQDSQTEKIGQRDHHMQTKVTEIQHSAMQTKVAALQHSAMQTLEKEISSSAMQTVTKQLATVDAQTEFIVAIVPPKADQGAQAGHWCPVDHVVQTDLSQSLMTEGGCQTFTAVLRDGDTQTLLVTGDQVTQTEVALAEAQCQTFKDERNVTSQTDVKELVENVMQTDISVALRAEQGAQATVEAASQESQATADVVVCEAQTDSSMALQADIDCQASVEVVESDMQTIIVENVDMDCQTEVETSQQCCQTELEVGDKDVQTEVPAGIDMECQTEPPPPPEEVAPEVVGADGLMPDLEGQEVPPPAPEGNREEGSQTDPVTIIIGDASFLVKKLKSSSLSPTKVSSAGNEIEIELRLDDDPPEPTPYDLPEKENIVSAPPPPLRKQQTPSPFRGRGVRTRGGLYGRGGHHSGEVRNSPAGSPQTVYNAHRSPASHSMSSPGQFSSGASPTSSAASPAAAAASAGAARPGKYSCPVCSATFHESPVLYEHLQQMHREAFSLIKKPRGREGKTIYVRKHSPEPEPPVLTPVEPILIGQGASTSAAQNPQVLRSEMSPQTQIVVQAEDAGGMFEEPAVATAIPGLQQQQQQQQQQLQANKMRKRSLARRQITDEETAVMPQEGQADDIQVVIATEQEAARIVQAAGGSIVTQAYVGKRKRESLEDLSKRLHVDEPPSAEEWDEEDEEEEAGAGEELLDEDEEEEEEEEEEVAVVVPVARRRGRPPKIKKEGAEAANPKKRSRTRSTKK